MCLIATIRAISSFYVPRVNLLIQVRPARSAMEYKKMIGRLVADKKNGVCVTLYSKDSLSKLEQIEKGVPTGIKKVGAPQPT